MTIEELLNQVSAGIDYAQDISGIVSGLSPAIAEKVIIAEADPTSDNVQAVFAAYAREGKIPSADLAAHLLMINEQRHPEDTVRGNATPFIFGASFILWLILRKRGGK